jgi:hypothetical protein
MNVVTAPALSQAFIKPLEFLAVVNTNFTRIDGPWSDPIQSDVLIIHHYAVRSAEDFAQKVAKGNGMDKVVDGDKWGGREPTQT